MQFTTQSQLMTNYVPGTPLSAQGRLRTVYSDTRSPMLFSLDANAQLGLTRPSATDPTGWARVDLNARLAGVPGLGKAPVVHSFAVSQDAEGGVWLVVAAAPKPGAMSQVYVSGRMSNGESTSDWDALADRLTPRKLPSGLKVTDIAVGHSTTPFSVAACLDAEGQVQYHQINPDPAGDWSTLLLPLPQNATRCAAVAVGHHRKLGQGVYSLFDLQTAQSLVFTTLPTMVRNHLAVDTVDLDLPDGIDARTLATMVNGDGSTDLYVGGEGVCRFSAAAQLTSHKPTEVLLDGSHVSGVRELVVATDRQNDGQISLWAIDHRDSLVYTEGSRSAEGSKYRWTPPLLLDTEVAALSAYRVMTETGQARSSAAMAVGGNDGNFRMVTQDPRTALWQQQTVSLHTDDDVQELSTYTTRVAVTKDTGAAVAGQQVLIEPDRDCAALINGRYYALRAGTPKPAVTDQDGTLTIVLETTDLTAPSYTFRTEDTEGVTVDPSAGTKNRLRALDGATIAKAVRANGKPLIDSPDRAKCDEAAQRVAELMAVHDKLAAQPGPALASTATVPSTGAGILSVAAGDLLAALRHEANVVKNHWIRATGAVWELLVEIGERTYRCLIDAAHVAISAIDWVLRHTLGLSLDELLELLGDVLNWNDILANHRVLAKIVTLSFDRMAEEMAKSKSSVDDWFSRVREHLVDGKLVVDRSADIFAERVGRPADSPHQSAIDSPTANLGKHHLAANRSRSRPGAFVPDDLGDVLHGLAENEVMIIQQVCNQVEGLFGDVLAGKSIGDVVTALMEIIELAVLDTVENLTLTVIDLGIVMVSVVKQILTARWNIPVLTPLYEKIICRGDGSRLTLLDLCCLLGAIPATIVGKLALDGRNLFSTRQIDAVGRATTWDALMAALAGGSPRAALRAAATSNDHVVVAAEVLQLVNAFIRDVSIGMGIAIDLFPEVVGEATPERRIKIGLDWTGYVFGVLGMLMIKPDHPTTRQQLDIAMSELGAIPVATACLQQYLRTAPKLPGGNGIAATDVARYIDSAYGVVILSFSVASVVLQAKEDPGKLAPAEYHGLLTLKTVQNLTAGLTALYSALLALPLAANPMVKAHALDARAVFSIIRAGAQTGRSVGQLVDGTVDFEGAVP